MGKTYAPKNKKRARKHGFLKRMSTTTGERTITKRRRKGRTKLSV
ncbi:MAG: 50S ribosomal protein L34 [Patescibacteria group bacterium]